jgi:hypothetical protein
MDEGATPGPVPQKPQLCYLHKETDELIYV